MDKQKKYKSEIIRKMKAVGTYNASFSYTIEILAKTLVDYEETAELYEQTGKAMIIEYTNKGGATNLIKNPLYVALEKLRNDIVAYSRELGLTPTGLKKINDKKPPEPKRTKLEMILNEIAE